MHVVTVWTVAASVGVAGAAVALWFAVRSWSAARRMPHEDDLRQRYRRLVSRINIMTALLGGAGLTCNAFVGAQAWYATARPDSDVAWWGAEHPYLLIWVLVAGCVLFAATIVYGVAERMLFDVREGGG